MNRSPGAVLLTSLEVSRLGTTIDGSGGSATSPVEAKIIMGSPRTRRGWGGNAGSINTDGMQ